MSKEYLVNWTKAAGIRAIKTVAQTAIATIGGSIRRCKLDDGCICISSCRGIVATYKYWRIAGSGR